MKIYFEDGELRKVHGIPEEDKRIVEINAEKGVSFCNVSIVYCASNYPSGAVYTNSLCGLKAEYSWNESSRECELYMRNDLGNWVKAEALLMDSDRLFIMSDIISMYLKGSFKRG